MLWRFEVLLVLQLQVMTVFSTWIEDIYSSPKMSANLIPILTEDDLTYVAGIDYFSVINRTSSELNVVEFLGLQSVLDLCKSVISSSDVSSCSNSVLILQSYDASTLFICSTNVRTPSCSFVNKQTFTKSDVSGIRSTSVWLPAIPGRPVLSILLDKGTSRQVYSATCLTTVPTSCVFTTVFNKAISARDNWFDSPTYINFYSSGTGEDQLVYLFFREKSSAFQYDTFQSGGVKSVYGMVARVCGNDTGGGYSMKYNFATFMKARLLCPYPGGTSTGSENMYFNYLRATSHIEGRVYGIFTHPPSWNTEATGVCGFDLSSIDSIMDGSSAGGMTRYYDAGAASTGYTRTFDNPTNFLPGQCPPPGQLSNNVDGAYETFIKGHALLGANVESPSKMASYVTQHQQFDFITAADMGPYHLLYLFTETGLMRKIRVDASDGSNTVVLAEAQVTNDQEKIVSTSLEGKDIMVVTPVRILHVAKAVCTLYTDCQKCEADPSCDWVRGCVRNEDDKNITIRSCLAAPPPPENVSVTESLNSIRIRWVKGVGDTTSTGYYYEVVRPNDGVLVVSGGATSGFVDLNSTTFVSGVRYLVKIQAIAATTSSDFVQKQFSRGLSAPTLTLSTAVNTMAEVEWTKVDGAELYNVTLYALDASNHVIQSYLITALDNNLTTQKLGIAGLVPGRRYKVIVFGISGDGIHSDKSNPVNFASVALVRDEATTSTQLSKSTTDQESISTSQLSKSTTDQESISTSQLSSINQNILTSASTRSRSTSERVATEQLATAKLTRTESLKGAGNGNSSSGLVVALVIFLIIVAICAFIFLQNYKAINSPTIHIIEGNSTKTLKRKGCFWLKEENSTDPASTRSNITPKAREQKSEDRLILKESLHGSEPPSGNDPITLSKISIKERSSLDEA